MPCLAPIHDLLPLLMGEISPPRDLLQGTTTPHTQCLAVDAALTTTRSQDFLRVVRRLRAAVLFHHGIRFQS